MRWYAPVFVLAAVMASQASAQTPWETVSSKEGQFTVEMPVKPTLQRTRTRKGPGGQIKVILIGCKTESGFYMAYKAEFPTAIAKGAEESQLDGERDELAQEWNGKVMSEKKVRAEGKIGRDVTIRGKPAEETGVLTIRVREYLAGKAIYAVMVVSAPNRELPEDAGRFLGSLALGTTRTRAAGTPEPEPKGKELIGWGLAIDPDKDCEFRPEGNTLSIQLPGKWHDLNRETGKLNAPRVLRPIEGDFVVTVKVTGDFQPAGKSTYPKAYPCTGAGIVVWSDSDNFIRLERAAILRDGKIRTFIICEEREGGYAGAQHNVAFPAGPVSRRRSPACAMSQS